MVPSAWVRVGGLAKVGYPQVSAGGWYPKSQVIFRRPDQTRPKLPSDVLCICQNQARRRKSSTNVWPSSAVLRCSLHKPCFKSIFAKFSFKTRCACTVTTDQSDSGVQNLSSHLSFHTSSVSVVSVIFHHQALSSHPGHQLRIHLIINEQGLQFLFKR
jgi:hypothetical protein